VITSEDVREELGRIAPKRSCDRRAELSALFHSAGVLHLRGKGDWGLHLDVGSGAAARRALVLLRESGISSEIRTYRRRAFDRATRYQLHVQGDEQAHRALVSAGVVDSRHAPIVRPPKRVVGRSCCRAAYLRGAFLGGGSISLGRSPHVELRTASPEAASWVAGIAHEEGIELSTAARSGHALAYAKSWEVIESLLVTMGASETALALEERAVLAQTRAQANRLANADHANLVRMSRSARVQLDAVARLRAEGILETLPLELRDIAELRLGHPSDSLRELAARTDPPVTKAAVHRRLRRLEELARSIS
jgi:DNA-binding protein WhiA